MNYAPVFRPVLAVLKAVGDGGAASPANPPRAAPSTRRSRRAPGHPGFQYNWSSARRCTASRGTPTGAATTSPASRDVTWFVRAAGVAASYSAFDGDLIPHARTGTAGRMPARRDPGQSRGHSSLTAGRPAPVVASDESSHAHSGPARAKLDSLWATETTAGPRPG